MSGLAALLIGTQFVGHVVMHLGHMAAPMPTSMPEHAGHHMAPADTQMMAAPAPQHGDAAMGLIPSPGMVAAHTVAALAAAVLLASAFALHTWLTRAYHRATLRDPTAARVPTRTARFGDVSPAVADGHRDPTRARGPPPVLV